RIPFLDKKTIRQTKPDILLTWNAFAPFEVHPDHRIVGMVATEAATFSHYPLYYPEHLQQGLQPHYVSEYLFFAKHNRDANKFVDITDFVDAKVECLLKHQTQIQQTMAETRMAFSHAGIDLAAILHHEEINPENHQQIASLAIKKLAENTGSKYGVAFAEEFRYEGFAPAKMFFPDLFKDREVEL
ncbi:hypothetical protein M1O57_03525, partial [Dehalococcoidia bacterium]|nr:hypothetical protein [Dehalococcoidia bacterium]